ncbi:MAG: hypothetical protein Q8J98_09695 [Phaeovulum sp.]|uniref:c-type cytochrome n=1 Tax=Phaeovulum sp. TaxID=2934796 RepID=UPI0027319182|nr:hypothetical protein [Phaeovulum sp.]MDP2063360.1 hypothetical protein [Phaeovulum sp.]
MRGGQMVVAGVALIVIAAGTGAVLLLRGAEENSPAPVGENSVTAGTPVISVTTSDERIAAAVAALAAAGPAEVTTANRREYYLQCRPCHSVTQPDGTVTELGSGLGPDLYGIIDRPAAQQAGFEYSESMRQAGEKGVIWTVENILRYSYNPKRYLREVTGDPKADGTMVYSLVKGHAPLVTYLRAVGPQP